MSYNPVVRLNEYDLRNIGYHLFHSHRFEELYSLVEDRSIFWSRTTRLGSFAAGAEDARHAVQAVANQIERNTLSGSVSSFVRLCKFALIQAAIRQSVVDLPPELLGLLAEFGHYRGAAEFAQTTGNPPDKVQALVYVADKVPESDSVFAERLLDQALSETSSLNDYTMAFSLSADILKVLFRVNPSEATTLYETLVEQAHTLSAAADRVGALLELGIALGEHDRSRKLRLVDQAVNIAVGGKVCIGRHWAGLIEALSNVGAPESLPRVVQSALAYVTKWEVDWSTNVLGDIALHLAERAPDSLAQTCLQAIWAKVNSWTDPCAKMRPLLSLAIAYAQIDNVATSQELWGQYIEIIGSAKGLDSGQVAMTVVAAADLYLKWPEKIGSQRLDQEISSLPPAFSEGVAAMRLARIKLALGKGKQEFAQQELWKVLPLLVKTYQNWGKPFDSLPPGTITPQTIVARKIWQAFFDLVLLIPPVEGARLCSQLAEDVIPMDNFDLASILVYGGAQCFVTAGLTGQAEQLLVELLRMPVVTVYSSYLFHRDLLRVYRLLHKLSPEKALAAFWRYLGSEWERDIVSGRERAATMCF